MARIVFAAALMLVVALGAAAAIAVPKGDRQLLAWDEGSTGLADARRVIEAHPRVTAVEAIVTTPEVLDEVRDPSRALVLAAGAERAYTSDESDALERFQARGGALVLLDKNERTTDLLSRYGVELDGREILSPEAIGPVLDVRARGGSPDAPLFDVALVRPTSLGLVPNWTGGQVFVLANTTHDAVIDVDGNGNVTPDIDIAASFPLIVLVRPEIGGPVLVVADPVAFTNQGLGLAQNRAFLTSVVERLLPKGGTVIFDESRHVQEGSYPLEILRLVVLSASGLGGMLLGTLLAVALAVVGVRHKGLAPYGHRYAPSDLVRVPEDEEGARRLLAGKDAGEPP